MKNFKLGTNIASLDPFKKKKAGLGGVRPPRPAVNRPSGAPTAGMAPAQNQLSQGGLSIVQSGAY